MAAKKEIERIGLRIAKLRRERGLTQVELSSKLGITQSHLSEYERGGLSLHGSQLIVKLTQALGITADELLGLRAPKGGRRATADLRLLRRLQKIEQLPPGTRRAVLKVIDELIQQTV